MSIRSTITASALTTALGLAGLLTTSTPASADPCPDDMHWHSTVLVGVDELAGDGGGDDMHW